MFITVEGGIWFIAAQVIPHKPVVAAMLFSLSGISVAFFWLLYNRADELLRVQREHVLKFEGNFAVKRPDAKWQRAIWAVRGLFVCAAMVSFTAAWYLFCSQ